MQTLKFIDKRQIEAAQSLESNKKTFYYVTCPQALQKWFTLVLAKFVTNVKVYAFFELMALIDMLPFVTNDAINFTLDLVSLFVILSFF